MKKIKSAIIQRKNPFTQLLIIKFLVFFANIITDNKISAKFLIISKKEKDYTYIIVQKTLVKNYL